MEENEVTPEAIEDVNIQDLRKYEEEENQYGL